MKIGRLKRIPVYTVKIVYKSGHVHLFDVTEFSYQNGSYQWATYDVQRNRPIDLGGPDVAAVWQVGVRFVWRWEK